MAVKLKMSVEKAKVLFGHLEIDLGIVDKLYELGVAMSWEGSKLVLSHSEVGVIEIGPYAPGVMVLAMKGMLGKESKSLLADDVLTKSSEMMAQVISLKTVGGYSEPVVQVAKVKKVSAKVSPAPPPPPKPAPVPKVEKPQDPIVVGEGLALPGDLEELLQQVPVPLREATRLYQPVRGTSDVSCYYAVAFTDKIAISARNKGESVSLRVERRGSAPAQVPESEANTLVLLGFTKAGPFHWSMHLSDLGNVAGVPVTVMAQRVIGSVLMSLPGQLKSVVPTLKPIMNKGI